MMLEERMGAQASTHKHGKEQRTRSTCGNLVVGVVARGAEGSGARGHGLCARLLRSPALLHSGCGGVFGVLRW